MLKKKYGEEHVMNYHFIFYKSNKNSDGNFRYKNLKNCTNIKNRLFTEIQGNFKYSVSVRSEPHMIRTGTEIMKVAGHQNQEENIMMIVSKCKYGLQLETTHVLHEH
jgi:hypothetical protein